MKKDITATETQNYIESRCQKDELTNCWIWSAAVCRRYGNVSKTNRAFKFTGERRAHRVSYVAFKGPIPDGLLVRHLCNNKLCCNPEHLEVGTSAQNRADLETALSDRDTHVLQNDLANVEKHLLCIDHYVENMKRLEEQRLSVMLDDFDRRMRDEKIKLQKSLASIDARCNKKKSDRIKMLKQMKAEIEEEIGRR